MFKSIFKKIERRLALRSSDKYILYLRKHGIKIGGGNYIDQKTCLIDLTRPSLVSIGDNCFFNSHFTLLTHDWVTNIFLNSGRDFINSSGRVTIGNNVSFGQHVMVLKGVTIGDNCFIGAGSIVTKDIPANSIAAGAPCRVVMTLEEYYRKRLQESESEALDYARSIKERYNRVPTAEDFWEEFIWFVSGNQINNYPEIPIRSQLGPMYDDYVKNHKAKYKKLEHFLQEAFKDN